MRKKKPCIMLDHHEKWNEMGVEICIMCKEKIGKSYMERLRDKIALIPYEDKQAFLNHLREGKNVGEAIKAVDPEGKYNTMSEWYQVLSDNIQTFSYEVLRKDAV
jgi:hypothetical protein